jgi:ADP-ribose pyrophosphatase YjhB (NUDIX family)
MRQVHVGALSAFRRLPFTAKRFVVGWITPSFQVGASVILRRADGALLLVRQSYSKGWTVPGGFLKRNEQPAAAAARETLEEIGVLVDLQGQPQVVFHTARRRIDVVFTAALSSGEPGEPYPRSPEIKAVGWFRPEKLPPLQSEAAAALAELKISPPA